MPSYSDPPFYAVAIISDSRYFVGYEAQLDTITNRAIAAQPTSINIVGDKRIGKSSLLYHFCQTYEEKIQNPRNFLAVYLSLQGGNCKLKFTNQQKVAVKAIVNIALDTLERCGNLRDIITITQELTWIPTPTPADIGTVLPDFLDKLIHIEFL